MTEVNNFIDLTKAIEQGQTDIVITRTITSNRSLILPENTSLSGKAQEDGSLPTIFFQDSDGLGLTTNNNISDIIINVPERNQAIFSSSNKTDLGDFHFDNLQLTGQFSFITNSQNKVANLFLKKVYIAKADTRAYWEQPQKYGVNVLQGALTIYNRNPDPDSLITVTADKISIGQDNNPVIGSGVFIAGFGDNGGQVEIERLQTRDVFSTGKLPFGVADLITAAIFIVNGAHAKTVINDGETTTYGVNDMVLDAWGKVDDWTINGPVVSYGPSGVGFVNFGIVKNFTANGPIETFGLGARGYNQYDGTLEKGHFSSIATFGDGSVGVQISKKVGEIIIDGSIKTRGGIGNSLVKGVNVDLPAYALSVKDGGEVEKIRIDGNIQTSGTDVTSYIVDKAGIVHEMSVGGKIIASGKNAKTIDVIKGGQTPTDFDQE